jgi:hypothetical protein
MSGTLKPMPAEPKTMSRASKYGEPPTYPLISELMPWLAKVVDPNRSGQATERQITSLRRTGLIGDPSQLTEAQAGALLSARRYAEGALQAMIPLEGTEEEHLLLTALAAFIVRDDDLRERAIDWNFRSYRRHGGHTEIPQPKRDKNLLWVQEEAKRMAFALHFSTQA